MIKELIELVTLVEQTMPQHEAMLGFLSRNNTEVLKLFHAIQVNHFRTEAEAIEKARVGERTKFRQVARDLLRCLEQMVLHIGAEKPVSDDLTQGRIRGFQLMALAKSSGPLACKNAGKKAAEELLQLGLQYARPEFVVEASKVLMDYVSVAGDDLKEYTNYLELYEIHNKWRLLEEKAQMYYNLVKIPYAKKKSIQKGLAEKAGEFLTDLEPFVGVALSHSFHVCYYHLKSYQLTILGDMRKASKVHEEAIAYFASRTYPCQHSLNVFHYLEIANCVYLGRYELGGFHFSQALEYSSPGNVNWFNTLELGFYLRMHEQDYVGAAAVWYQATHHKRFAVLREAQRETWHVMGAYLFIIQQLTGVSIPENHLPKVKSRKFRNEIKDLAQDKMGMNIAVLAAEVLLLFVEERDDEMWDRIAALEKYRERYLRNSEETHRSQLFIKMLTILSRYHYDRDRFLSRAEPYLAELRAAPLQLSNQAHELEIVPYEHLIRAIARHLNRRWGHKGELPELFPGLGAARRSYAD
ncbi:MAG: hypothetical protein J0M29_16150 [Chitinophagales bacterium]|nr:hypothetical protein [Chitinophagales bacterium]